MSFSNSPAFIIISTMQFLKHFGSKKDISIVIFLVCLGEDSVNECQLLRMFLENTLAALEEVFQMILCKFETNKLCSQYVFSCLKAQLSCSKFCNCHGSMT